MIILLKSVGQIPKQVVFSYPQGWEKKCLKLCIISLICCLPHFALLNGASLFA